MVELGRQSAPSFQIESPDYLRGLPAVAGYSICLLHPFAPVVTTRVLGEGWVGYSAAAVGTLAMSYVTYRWLELPMMRLGKRLASKMATGETVEAAT